MSKKLNIYDLFSLNYTLHYMLKPYLNLPVNSAGKPMDNKLISSCSNEKVFHDSGRNCWGSMLLLLLDSDSSTLVSAFVVWIIDESVLFFSWIQVFNLFKNGRTRKNDVAEYPVISLQFLSLTLLGRSAISNHFTSRISFTLCWASLKSVNYKVIIAFL